MFLQNRRYLNKKWIFFQTERSNQFFYIDQNFNAPNACVNMRLYGKKSIKYFLFPGYPIFLGPFNSIQFSKLSSIFKLAYQELTIYFCRGYCDYFFQHKETQLYVLLSAKSVTKFSSNMKKSYFLEMTKHP